MNIIRRVLAIGGKAANTIVQAQLGNSTFDEAVGPGWLYFWVGIQIFFCLAILGSLVTAPGVKVLGALALALLFGLGAAVLAGGWMVGLVPFVGAQAHVSQGAPDSVSPLGIPLQVTGVVYDSAFVKRRFRARSAVVSEAGKGKLDLRVGRFQSPLLNTPYAASPETAVRFDCGDIDRAELGTAWFGRGPRPGIRISTLAGSTILSFADARARDALYDAITGSVRVDPAAAETEVGARSRAAALGPAAVSIGDPGAEGVGDWTVALPSWRLMTALGLVGGSAGKIFIVIAGQSTLSAVLGDVVLVWVVVLAWQGLTHLSPDLAVNSRRQVLAAAIAGSAVALGSVTVLPDQIASAVVVLVCAGLVCFGSLKTSGGL